REAISGTTPPKCSCRSSCDATTDDKTCRSSRMTAAAVSSHVVSIASRSICFEVIYGTLCALSIGETHVVYPGGGNVGPNLVAADLVPREQFSEGAFDMPKPLTAFGSANYRFDST